MPSKKNILMLKYYIFQVRKFCSGNCPESENRAKSTKKYIIRISIC